jgi:hypothetical protein
MLTTLTHFSLSSTTAMSTPHLTLLFLIVCVFFVYSRADLAIGTRCLLQDYSRGICVNIKTCALVMEQIRSGNETKLSICSRTEKTVCCPFQQQGVVRPAALTTESTTIRPRSNLKRISEQSENFFK